MTTSIVGMIMTATIMGMIMMITIVVAIIHDNDHHHGDDHDDEHHHGDEEIWRIVFFFSNTNQKLISNLTFISWILVCFKMLQMNVNCLSNPPSGHFPQGLLDFRDISRFQRSSPLCASFDIRASLRYQDISSSGKWYVLCWSVEWIITKFWLKS